MILGDSAAENYMIFKLVPSCNLIFLGSGCLGESLRGDTLTYSGILLSAFMSSKVIWPHTSCKGSITVECDQHQTR